MKHSKKPAVLIPLAMAALLTGLLLTRRSAPIFGVDADLLAGLAVGAGVGLLLVLIVFIAVKAPPER
jgi:hypothetical protein